MEEERRVAEDARQALVLLEKKRISLQTELDDLHSVLENVRRQRYVQWICSLGWPGGWTFPPEPVPRVSPVISPRTVPAKQFASLLLTWCRTFHPSTPPSADLQLTFTTLIVMSVGVRVFKNIPARFCPMAARKGVTSQGGGVVRGWFDLLLKSTFRFSVIIPPPQHAM